MSVDLRLIQEPPQEQVKCRQSNTVAIVKSKNLGKGTLIVAESRLSWLTDDGQGFALEYPNIQLHAISKDLTNFPAECLYLMVDDPNQSDSEIGEGDDEEPRASEIRFVPDDKSCLDELFRAMSECQLLHPDPNDSISEEDEGDEEGGGDFVIEGSEDLFEDAEADQESSAGVTSTLDAAVGQQEQTGATGTDLNKTNGDVEAGNADEPMDTSVSSTVPGQFDDADAE